MYSIEYLASDVSSILNYFDFSFNFRKYFFVTFVRQLFLRFYPLKISCYTVQDRAIKHYLQM